VWVVGGFGCFLFLGFVQLFVYFWFKIISRAMMKGFEL